MSNSSPEVNTLAETILRVATVGGPMMWDVGVVRVPPQVGPASAGVVYVRGITDQEIPISASSWASPFVSQMASTDLSDRRVLVAFVNAQPLLLCTIGV